MKRTTTILVALAVVLAMTAVPLAGAVTYANSNESNTNDQAANESAAPGEKLGGVVGVQAAEIDGEVDERTYGVQIAQAQTEDAQADVVNDTLTDVEDRLEAQEAELEALEEARDDGEISNGTYQAKVAGVAAEKATTERLVGHANATASELPADVLEERGIDHESIAELQERANELGGEEVAEIAQSIAGDRVGQGVAADRAPGTPADVPGGDGDDATNQSEDAGNLSDRDGAIDRADTEIDRVADEIDRANDSVDDDEDAQQSLEDAQAAYENATAALEDATALADDDAEAALEHAEAALEYAEAALEHAEDATERAEGGNGEAGQGSGNAGE